VGNKTFLLYTELAAKRQIGESAHAFYKNETDWDTRSMPASQDLRRQIDELTPGEIEGGRADAEHVKWAESFRAPLTEVAKGEKQIEDAIIPLMEQVFNAREGVDILLRAKVLTMLCNLALSREFFNSEWDELAPCTELTRLKKEHLSQIGDVGDNWVLASNPVNGLQEKRQGEQRVGEDRRVAESIFKDAQEWRKGISKEQEKRREALGERPEFCKPLELYGWAIDRDGDFAVERVGRQNAMDEPGQRQTLYFVHALEQAEEDDSENQEDLGGKAWELVSCGTASLENRLRKVQGIFFGTPIFVEVASTPVERVKVAK